MSKLDELNKAAASLREDQLDGVIDYVRSLAAGGTVFDSAPREVRDSIERALSEHQKGESLDAGQVFDRLKRRVGQARPPE